MRPARRLEKRGQNYGAATAGNCPPSNREDLGEYLRHLKEALIVAKVSRAHAAASLVRLNAAAQFNIARKDHSRAPGFWRNGRIPAAWAFNRSESDQQLGFGVSIAMTFA